MNSPVWLIIPARQEHVEAVRHYRERSRQAARDFEREYKAVIAFIGKQPLLGTPYHHGTRRKLFPSFPYAIIYTIELDGVVVQAIFHQHREPEYWADRLAPMRQG